MPDAESPIAAWKSWLRSLPPASRIVFIHVRETPRLDGSNRYIDPVPYAVAADLVDLGVHIPEADRLNAFTREFVGTSPNQVTTTQDQAIFAGMLDRGIWPNLCDGGLRRRRIEAGEGA